MPELRIAAAQVPSIRGDFDSNLATHLEAIDEAARHGVSVLVFPELSLTGYEPDLAADLATTPDDPRFDALGERATRFGIEIVVGVPLVNGPRSPFLGAILFHSDGRRRTYRKMHLGSSERAWFTPGLEAATLESGGITIGLAICADASNSSHPERYAAAGASVYAAGVFLNEEWYSTDAPRLAAYAERLNMAVVMANHGESNGTLRSVGRSTIWAAGGETLAQATGAERCLLMLIPSRGTAERIRL